MWKVERAAVLGEEDEEGEAAIWGILRKLGAQRLQCPQARLIKQTSRGAVAPPFRSEQKPRKRSGLAVSSRWAQSGPTSPSRAQRSNVNGSTLDPGARLYIVNSESQTQDDGRVLGPLWPTSLAIGPAALAARATGTMPGGYCHNSGTWGSPDASKVGPTPWAHQEDKQDTESR